MFIQKVEGSPLNERGGQLSYLLLDRGQFGSSRLSVTWVEGKPGSEQQIHAHETNEQVYVVVRGRGLMRVADEQAPVEAGDLVFIPPKTGHAMRNVGDGPLIYLSATSPPFDRDALERPFRYV